MIGRALSHYAIVSKLGEGAMGEVYLAEDRRLGRRVALKIPPAGLGSDPERISRYEREARAVAALNHPHIVTLHSIEEADGLLFLIMELVEGRNLAQLLPAGGFELGRLFELAVPIADALAAAHEAGVIHRDLKPENIMVTDKGVVKVLDFGLAKLSREGREGAETEEPTRTLTRDGVVMGTLPYMSPEQVQGKPLDSRSDIFSLGVILYEMATGSRPFRGETAAHLISSIMRDQPPAITEIKAGLPNHLARVVRHCLEKEPRRRYQSALDVLNELSELRRETETGALRAGGGPAAAPSGGVDARPSDALPAAAPRRTAAWVGAGIGVFLLVLAGGWWLGRSRVAPPGDGPAPPPAPRGRQMIVVLPFENLGPAEDEYFADGVSEEITSRLASVSELGVISRSSAIQYKERRPPTRQIGEELGVDYLLEGTVRWERQRDGSSRVRVTPQLIRVVDDTHVWSDRFDRELARIFEVQSEIAEAVTRQIGVTLLDTERAALAERPTENLEAYQAYLRGLGSFHHPEFSERTLSAAVEMFRRAKTLDPGFAQAHAQWSYAVARYHWHTGTFRTDWIPAAREAAAHALELAPGLPEGKLALGFVHYYGERDYERALRDFREVEAARPSDSEAVAAMGFILRRLGRLDQAIERLERAVELDPKSAMRINTLAGTYAMVRRYDDALRSLDRAIALVPHQTEGYLTKMALHVSRAGDLEGARAVLAEIPAETAETQFMRAWLMSLEGRYGEALDFLDGLPLVVFEGNWIGYVPKDLVAAHLLHLEGRPEIGRESAARAAAILATYVSANPSAAFARSLLGFAHALSGRESEAIQEALAATEVFPLSKDALHGPALVWYLGAVYAWCGEPEKALDQAELLLSVPAPTSIHELRLDPYWQPVWDHPRFQALVRKYG